MKKKKVPLSKLRERYKKLTDKQKQGVKSLYKAKRRQAILEYRRRKNEEHRARLAEARRKYPPSKSHVKFSVQRNVVRVLDLLAKKKTKAQKYPKKRPQWGIHPTIATEHEAWEPGVAQDPDKVYGIFHTITKRNMFVGVISASGQMISLETTGSIGVTHKPFKKTDITAHNLAKAAGARARKKGVRSLSFFRRAGRGYAHFHNIVQGFEKLGIVFNPRPHDGFYKIFKKSAWKELRKARQKGMAGLLVREAYLAQEPQVLFGAKHTNNRPHNGTRKAKKKTMKKHYAPRQKFFKPKFPRTAISWMIRVLQKGQKQKVHLPMLAPWLKPETFVRYQWAFCLTMYRIRSYRKVFKRLVVSTKEEELLPLKNFLGRVRYYYMQKVTLSQFPKRFQSLHRRVVNNEKKIEYTWAWLNGLRPWFLETIPGGIHLLRPRSYGRFFLTPLGLRVPSLTAYHLPLIHLWRFQKAMYWRFEGKQQPQTFSKPKGFQGKHWKQRKPRTGPNKFKGKKTKFFRNKKFTKKNHRNSIKKN